MKRIIFVIFIFLFVISCGSKQTDLVKADKSNARDLLQQGNESFREGRYVSAAKYYDRARLIAISIDDLVVRADADNNLGQLYLMAGDYKSAKKKFGEAMSWSNSVNYNAGLAASMSGMGMVAMSNKNYNVARRWLEEAKLSVPKGAMNAAIESNLGEVFRRQKKYNESMQSLKAAITESTKLKSHMIAALAYYRMALLQRDLGNVKLAIINANNALDEDKKIEHSPGIAKDLELLATLSKLDGDQTNALLYEKRAHGVRLMLAEPKGPKVSN